MTGYQSKKAMAQHKGEHMKDIEARELASQFGSRMCDENGNRHGEELYCFSLDDIIAIKEALAQPAQRPWVGLTKEDMPGGENPMFDHEYFIAGMVFAANILKEKNNGT
jgi:hypothetical protein